MEFKRKNDSGSIERRVDLVDMLYQRQKKKSDK